MDTLRAWVEVDLGALVANYDRLHARAKPRAGMLPVVKADAYGLGVGPVVRALETRQPWGYAIATLAEGIEVRELGIERPILLLFCTPDELEGASEARLIPAIGDSDSLARWREVAGQTKQRLPFHLEIDTGMGRCGFHHAALARWLPEVLGASERDLHWQGTFTHFHSADVADATATEEQWDLLQGCLAQFPPGVGGLVHATASVASARWPEYAADLARPGIFLYGGVAGSEPFLPEPVATVRSRVTAVRDVPEGWTASYGATYRAGRPSRWATLAIGYADGLRRELSSNGFVRLGEREAPIIGRVCMDVMIVDVTDTDDVRPGDVATVIGGPHESPVSLASVAERCGTITYEILTGLTKRLPRRYVGLG